LKQASIHFFSENVHFVLKQKKKIRKWIDLTIKSESKITDEINYIFCNDAYLLSLNLKYLQHNTFTDIITFNNAEIPDIIQGDIFISIDRVKENAKQYGVSFVNELNRVIIHGILHLCGYMDKTDEEIKVMRQKEDYYLSLLPGLKI